jgi:hypothetical protein
MAVCLSKTTTRERELKLKPPKQNKSHNAPERSGKPVYHTDRFSRQHMRTYEPNTEAVFLYHRAAGWETWEQIAKQHNIPVEVLLGFNFPGSVSCEGRILPNVVNWFLLNNIYFRTPRAADGVNARFRGGELIAIPKTAAMPQAPTVIGASCQGSSGPPELWVGEVLSGGKAAVYVEKPPVPAPPPVSALPSDLEAWARVPQNDKNFTLRYGVSLDRRSVYVTEIIEIPDMHIPPRTFTIRLKEKAPEKADPRFDAIVDRALTDRGERARPALPKRMAGSLWNTLYMWVNPQCKHDHNSLDQEYERQCEWYVPRPNDAPGSRD